MSQLLSHQILVILPKDHAFLTDLTVIQVSPQLPGGCRNGPLDHWAHRPCPGWSSYYQGALTVPLPSSLHRAPVHTNPPVCMVLERSMCELRATTLPGHTFNEHSAAHVMAAMQMSTSHHHLRSKTMLCFVAEPEFPYRNLPKDGLCPLNSTTSYSLHIVIWCLSSLKALVPST